MKKAILVLLVVVLIAAPLAAAPKFNIKQASKGRFGLGLNAGTNLGLAFKFDNRDWDLYGNIGTAYKTKSWGFSGEVGAEFPVRDIDVPDGRLYIALGAQVPLTVANSVFGVGVLATAGLNYEFPKNQFQTSLRLGAGLQMGFASGAPSFNFGFSGALGFVYLF